MNCSEAIQPIGAINPYYWQDFQESFDFEMKWRQTLVVFDAAANKNSQKVGGGGQTKCLLAAIDSSESV